MMQVFQMFYDAGHLHLAEAELAFYYPAGVLVLCTLVGFQGLPQYLFTFASSAKLCCPAAS